MLFLKVTFSNSFQTNYDQSNNVICVIYLTALIEVDSYSYPDDCIYGLALSGYLRGELTVSLRWCERLLRMRPGSERAQRLHQLVRAANIETREKSVEAVAIGGAIVVGIAGIALALAAGGKSKR